MLSKKKLLLVLIIAAIGYYLFNQTLAAQIDIPKKPTISSVTEWWNNEYAYRKQVLISSSASQILEINHAQMVIDGKSNSDGSDLKIIGQKDSLASEVAMDISDPDKTSTKIEFKTLTSSDLKYYLYYGNKNPEINKVLGTSDITGSSNTMIDREESPIITLNSFKKWVLKETDNKDISFRIQTKENINQDSKTFAIINNDEINKIPTQYKDGIINISSDKLKTGTNRIYIVSNIDGKIFRSNTISFNFSAPVYVAWTIDWEGTIPDYKYLDAMEEISDNYSVPMTHYYNPRIYTNIRVTDTQRNYVSDWITKRSQLGDDIGMHMHMQHDMVEEAGIKAKYNAPTWDNGSTGYDTPSTEYTYDEYLKLLNWGKTELKTQLKRFSDFDLPELQGYRAGGWFANLENLKAIQDAGFVYDTSGRVAFPIGANKMAQPWNLQTTSQPYYISTLNQNLSTDPTLKIKELPDNGADSYWSTENELKANFLVNYDPGTVLEQDKLIVFLSHPDWFYIDDPKLKGLFSEINKYRNDFDMGPVKFVTMREYLEKSEYIKSIEKQ